MAIEFSFIDAITGIATLLSLAGNWFVIKLDATKQKTGYCIWIVSNIIWVGYFIWSTQLGPLVLFTAYLLIAMKAVWDRTPPLIDSSAMDIV